MLEKHTILLALIRNRWRPAVAIGFLLVVSVFAARPYFNAAVQVNTAGEVISETISALSARFACEMPPANPENPRLSTAVAELRQVLERQPTYSDAAYRLGQSLCLLGAPEQALEPLRLFARLRPDNPLGRLELALAYNQLMQRRARTPLFFVGSDLTLTPTSFQTGHLGLIGCRAAPKPPELCLRTGWMIAPENPNLVVLTQPVGSSILLDLDVPNEPAAILTAPWPGRSPGTGMGESRWIYTIQILQDGLPVSERAVGLAASSDGESPAVLVHDLTAFRGTRVQVSFSIESRAPAEAGLVSGWTAPVVIPLGIEAERELFQAMGAAAAAEWRAAGYGGGSLLSEARDAAAGGDLAEAYEWFRRSDAFLYDAETSANFQTSRTRFSEPVNPDLSTPTGDVVQTEELAAPFGWNLFTHRGMATADWVSFKTVPREGEESPGYFQLVPERTGLDLVIASKPLLLGSSGLLTVSGNVFRSAPGVTIRLEIQYRTASGETLNVIGSEPASTVGDWETLALMDFTPQSAVWAVVRFRMPQVDDPGTVVRLNQVVFEHRTPIDIIGFDRPIK